MVTLASGTSRKWNHFSSGTKQHPQWQHLKFTKENSYALQILNTLSVSAPTASMFLSNQYGKSAVFEFTGTPKYSSTACSMKKGHKLQVGYVKRSVPVSLGLSSTTCTHFSSIQGTLLRLVLARAPLIDKFVSCICDICICFFIGSSPDEKIWIQGQSQVELLRSPQQHLFKRGSIAKTVYAINKNEGHWQHFQG